MSVTCSTCLYGRTKPGRREQRLCNCKHSPKRFRWNRASSTCLRYRNYRGETVRVTS